LAEQSGEVQVGDKRLALSHLDKVLYPKAGFTKAQVIDYYVRIAPVLLPHLRGRPLTMKRYPDGVEGAHFFEKQCPSYRPGWIKTAPVYSSTHERTMDYCLVEDLASLVWVANLGSIELHLSLSLAEALDRPTVLAFDLDPGLPATIVDCCEVALLLRALLEHLHLESFPKTSGAKGLQLYVPLNAPVSYDETKLFARKLAELLERERPDLVVSSMKKSLRAGKVLVDWSQNDEHKTTVAVYSLRAQPRPTVSTPVSWDEVERAARKQDPQLLVFDAAQALTRVEKHGDLFAPVLELEQRLPSLGL
jgi:bifunctional non-homologous end joining protein LigD